MRKIRLILLSFLVVSILSLQAIALEGFQTRLAAAPSILSKAWYSSFLVFLDEPLTTSIGTAVLFKAIIGQDETQLYFITNKHVLHGNCQSIGVCSILRLYRDAQINVRNSQMSFVSGTRELTRVEVLKQSANPDLALLKVSLKNKLAVEFHPIQMPKDCKLKVGEPLFSIGFPDASMRTYKDSVAIEYPNQIVKRWSQGLYVGGFERQTKGLGESRFIGVSSDSLSGSSGGPILNLQGELVGIVKASAGNKENEYRYLGDERPGNLDWHSLAIPCAEINEFIR